MSINYTPGSATANSYISVASADEYFATRSHSESWDSITSASTGTLSATTQKENLLKQATRELDKTYRYHDSKYYQGIRGQDTYQALEFPRSSNIDADFSLYIPDEIREATCEQAAYIKIRAGKKTAIEGVPSEWDVIGTQTYNYIKGWVNRQVMGYGSYPWQGSAY